MRNELLAAASLAALLDINQGYAQVAVPGPAPPAAIPIYTTGTAIVTGTTAETNLSAIKIPANSMGKNGMVDLKCLFTMPNNANSKSTLYRFNSTSGATSGNAASVTTAFTTQVETQQDIMIRNTNSTGAQVAYDANATSPFGNTTNAIISVALDTTVDNWVNVNGIVANGTDTLTLQHCGGIIVPSVP